MDEIDLDDERFDPEYVEPVRPGVAAMRVAANLLFMACFFALMLTWAVYVGGSTQ